MKLYESSAPIITVDPEDACILTFSITTSGIKHTFRHVISNAQACDNYFRPIDFSARARALADRDVLFFEINKAVRQRELFVEHVSSLIASSLLAYINKQDVK